MNTINTKVCPVCGSSELIPFLSCEDFLTTKEVFNICKCKSCNFALTQDFPAEDEIGPYYDAPAYISHSDSHKGIINSLYHLARKIALRSKSKIVTCHASKKTGMLLDIGSGTGYFLNKMKSKKWIVTGIEKSDAARKYAKQKFGMDCQNSEYLYDIPAKTKDIVTMWHVLEHLEHLNKVMEHLHTILKDDGVAIIALPNKDSFDAGYYKEYWAAYDVPRHLWHFSPADFKYLADRHHFELQEIRPMNFDSFYISLLSEQNKGTFMASLVGLVKGGIFFLRSLANKKRCSSLIYILKKK
ncbi:class I SAM-dependent methyltransferase [Dysgonomonas sp. Marseille-P4677]|uniref:class I SAM-dependent methyltransferase n=1 Tax=Dysgonomonas sp. Marseille-P4677 TaxID=2364790 RepID=UPI0019147D00|nr:class I SAM-dependent methyltransferase [Dysgonomonas sp. Marseille-P4677]MBK5720272.1 class I SAM-dependent methyltransferase [Dysgonomonas sp. Marseille-P4677]